MEYAYSKKSYLWVSMIFLCIQILVTLRNYQETLMNFFWFCDFAALLFFFGFYFKDSQFVKSIINIGLIPQVYFLGEFFAHAVGIIFIPGKVAQHDFLYGTITVLIHLTTLFALFFTYKEKTKQKSLSYSIIILFGMYLATRLFTNAHDEVNYVFSNTSLTDIQIPFHLTLWVPLTFIILVLPTYFLQKFLYLKNISRHSLNKFHKDSLA